MNYAVMQKDLEAPPIEKLKNAFRVLPFLTDLDAQTSANDAYGTLIRNLELPDAKTLQEALTREGVETEVVEQSTLPLIPTPKFAKQAEILAEALVLADSLGHKMRVTWDQILMIAAGNVRTSEVKKVKMPLQGPQYRGSGISYDTMADVKSREESRHRLLLDIILVGSTLRYSIPVEEFLFNCLGPRQTNSVPQNAMLFVQAIAQFAPHAGLNRGAFFMCEMADQLFSYPSKNAFYEEIIWLLWRAAQMRSG